jgi:hypothetical protein
MSLTGALKTKQNHNKEKVRTLYDYKDVVWGVKVRNLVGWYLHCRAVCCLHLQGGRVTSVLKMEAVDFYQIYYVFHNTGSYIPEDVNICLPPSGP